MQKRNLQSIFIIFGSFCLFGLPGGAILHYDAFEIKAGLIQGRKISFINRVASKPFLKLMRKLDPMRFVQKSSKAKEEITRQILIQDFHHLFDYFFGNVFLYNSKESKTILRARIAFWNSSITTVLFSSFL